MHTSNNYWGNGNTNGGGRKGISYSQIEKHFKEDSTMHLDSTKSEFTYGSNFPNPTGWAGVIVFTF